MIKKIKSSERYNAKHGWLSSYHLFSFADYYDPNNMNFGALRVFNDDTIDGESGFGAHSHRDMEIVTIMLEGELTHQDDIGNTKVMKQGEVQYMSAGTGVTHSEMNMSKEKTHLYQLWIMPRVRNLSPDYDQKTFDGVEGMNTLIPVASNVEKNGVIVIQADATIYKAQLESGKAIDYYPAQGRGVFIYITEGVLTINEIEFAKEDQARIEDEEKLTIIAKETSAFVMVDVIL